jgi:hypothetical protein
VSELITIKETEALQAKNVETLRQLIERQGAQIEQLAAAVISLDARLAEATQAAQSVTVSHKQVKQLQAQIRARAADVCDKNGIADPKAAAAFKAAIKKDLMAAWGVSDLHDLPLSAWDRAVWAVGSWSRYAVIKRFKYGPHPAVPAATFPRGEDRTSSTASRSPFPKGEGTDSDEEGKACSAL